MTESKKAIILIVALAICAGCAKARPPAVAREEGVRTRAAASLEKRVRGIIGATLSLKALAWMEIDSGEKDWRTDAAVVIERPGRLRVDAMDSLADVWASAGSDGRSMWLYIPGKRKLYEGRATPRNVERLAGFGIEPADLVSLMAGAPPLAEGEQITEASGRTYVFPRSGLRCTLVKGRVDSCAKPSDDGPGVDYEVSFADYRKVGGVKLPHEIRASFPGRSSGLTLRYKELQLGGEVADDAFAPPRRRGIRTHRYSR